MSRRGRSDPKPELIEMLEAILCRIDPERGGEETVAFVYPMYYNSQPTILSRSIEMEVHLDGTVYRLLISRKNQRRGSEPIEPED